MNSKPCMCMVSADRGGDAMGGYTTGPSIRNLNAWSNALRSSAFAAEELLSTDGGEGVSVQKEAQLAIVPERVAGMVVRMVVRTVVWGDVMIGE